MRLFPVNENKGLLIPKGLKRLSEENVPITFDQNCASCGNLSGFMVPCGQNFKRTVFKLDEKSNK